MGLICPTTLAFQVRTFDPRISMSDDRREDAEGRPLMNLLNRPARNRCLSAAHVHDGMSSPGQDVRSFVFRQNEDRNQRLRCSVCMIPIGMRVRGVDEVLSEVPWVSDPVG